MNEDRDWDAHDEAVGEGGFLCRRCDGDGEINCYCGGDLCVCENYGEKPCPRCHGSGDEPRQAAS